MGQARHAQRFDLWISGVPTVEVIRATQARALLTPHGVEPSMMQRTLLPSALAVVLAAGLTPARADTTVHVKLTGESHEQMGLEVSPASAPAGRIEFDVTNAAAKTGHEMILVRVASRDTKLVVDPAKNRVNEAALKSLGEVSNLKAGASGVLKANVPAGDYVLFCNIKGHYQAGMYAPFTVTP
jgi:uncharacterized cupredoxin-like copper-binding protein